MRDAAFAQYPWVDLQLVGFMLFLVFFIGMFFYVFRKGSKAYYQEMAMLPLKDQ